MEEKLRILMQRENLTASRLAEILETKPAAISHILNGRNKPGFELICKIVKRFPQINPHWLLGDDEQIYATSTPEASVQTPTSGNLFDTTPDLVATTTAAATTGAVREILKSSDDVSEIEHIIVVYRDKRFELLSPKM
ncbi:MAG: helix-turn-helix transcriptional regulator [Alistipes sp.]|nr:helix-turn-helix transcriptional regulator [Alistipes sp.]